MRLFGSFSPLYVYGTLRQRLHKQKKWTTSVNLRTYFLPRQYKNSAKYVIIFKIFRSMSTGPNERTGKFWNTIRVEKQTRQRLKIISKPRSDHGHYILSYFSFHGTRRLPVSTGCVIPTEHFAILEQSTFLNYILNLVDRRLDSVKC